TGHLGEVERGCRSRTASQRYPSLCCAAGEKTRGFSRSAQGAYRLFLTQLLETKLVASFHYKNSLCFPRKTARTGPFSQHCAQPGLVAHTVSSHRSSWRASVF